MTALSVGNAGSLVTRTIDQAKSKDLMLRELFQNALEATEKQIVGKKKVHLRITDPSWFGMNGYSTKKFGIFNTGPGMSAFNLRKATDLSSSIAKVQGIHNNFGEGAKVACLPVNKSGMIWISCHAGEVNMVVLRLAPDPLTKEERYERQDFQADTPGGTTDVVNITSLFDDQESMISAFGSFTNPSGLDTSEDWTYIILCGNEPKQDTTANPYGVGNATGAWALNEIYKRFAYISPDVEVRSEIHSKARSLKRTTFTTVLDIIKDRATKFPDKVQFETVSIPVESSKVEVFSSAESGTINITYVYDGPWGSGGVSNADKPTTVINNYATCPIFSGVIYKDEIYDVRGGNEGTTTWQVPAKECGILYGFKYFRVFVHLPESNDIITDRYRTELLANNYVKTKILFTDYKHEIYNNMPEWFIDKMKDFAPKPMNLSDIHKELDKLMKSVRVQYSASRIITNTSGTLSIPRINSNPTNNRGGGHGSTNNGTSLGTALIPGLTGKQKQVQQFPNIEVLSEKDIKKASVNSNFQYKAAEYAIDRNILFINATYPAVTMIREDLLSTYVDPTEEVEQLAYETSVSLVTKLVGTGLVYGLAKQGKPGYEDDFEKAIDPACLSTHADKWEEGFASIKKKFDENVVILTLNNYTAKAA